MSLSYKLQKNDPCIKFKKYKFKNEEICKVLEKKITDREIDILSFMVHGKSSKIIGGLLGISPRTVEVHVSHIMKKLGVNSKQHILDFMEKKNAFSLFREHYKACLNKYYFDLKLKDLQKELGSVFEGGAIKLHIGYGHFLSRALEEDFIKLHMPLEISFSDDMAQPVLIFQTQSQEYYQYLISKEFESDYHFHFLKLFHFFISSEKITEIHLKYTQEEEKDESSWNHQHVNKSFFNKKTPIIFVRLMGVFLLAIGGGGFFYVKILSLSPHSYSHYSNVSQMMHGPHETLVREPLRKKIEESLQHKNMVLLTGIGGSGKTTLAKLYTLSSEIQFAYVVNCESLHHFKKSFREIGFSLCKNDKEFSEFSQILTIGPSKERQLKIVHHVQEKLKYIKKWILIFDNVNEGEELIKDIPLYFFKIPQGRFIFTSRNSTLLKKMPFIEPYMQQIEVPPLTPQESFSLFLKILSFSTNSSPIDENKIKDLLNKIAPFPLDIVLIAHYIKNAYHKDINVEFMSEISDYVNSENFKSPTSMMPSRHIIMKHGFDEIILKHPQYKKILCVCAALNTTRIPFEFLNLVAGTSFEVNEFIHAMQQYSFIEHEKTSFYTKKEAIHFHHVVKKHLQEYVQKNIDKEEQKESVSSFFEYLYLFLQEKIYNQDREKISEFITTLEDFRKTSVLSVCQQQKIKLLLALSYKILYNYEASKKLLIENIETLTQSKEQESMFYAQHVVHLGMVYRNLGRFDLAHQQFLLYESLQHHFKKNDYFNFKVSLEHAKLYRNKGIYKKAIELNQKSLEGFLTYFPKDYVHIAAALNSTGAVFRILGEVDNSFKYLNEALELSKKKLHHQYSIYPSILIQLGNLYRYLGDYQKAKKFHQKSVEVFKEKFPMCQRDMAYALTALGGEYYKLKDYEKAQNCFLESQSIFQKNFSKDYRENIWNLTYLGMLDLKKGNFEKGREFLIQANELSQKGFPLTYIDRAWIIMNLAYSEALLFNQQKSLMYVKQAEDIYNQTFSQDHFFYAWLLMRKAKIFKMINKTDNAKELALKSLKQCEKIFGQESIKSKEYQKQYQEIILISDDLKL